MSQRFILVISICFLSPSFSLAQFNPENPCEDVGNCVPEPTPAPTPDPDTNPTPEPGQPQSDERKPKLKVDIIPIPYLNFDFGQKVVNLTPHTEEGDEDKGDEKYRQMFSEFPNYYTPHAETLQIGNYSDGFRVTNYYKVEAGLGLGAVMHFEQAQGLQSIFHAMIGVLPVVGSSVSYERFVPAPLNLDALPARAIPAQATDLQGWTVGDSFTFHSTGGVVFFMGVGLGPIGLGGARLSTGEWKTYIEKQEPSLAYVKVTNTKLTAYSLFTGTLIASLSVSSFGRTDDEFSYTFNLNDPEAVKAYEDAVKGNLILAQTMSASKGGSVQIVESAHGISRGRSKSFSFGLPIFLNTRWSSGEIHTFKATDFHLEDTRTEANYGLYFKGKMTNLFFDHRNRVKSFYGAASRTRDARGNWQDTYFGQMVLSDSNEDTSHFRFRMAIKELVRTTGLQKELAINIPPIKDMGYSGVRLTMTIPKEATDKLILLKAQRSPSLISIGKSLYADYFRTDEDNNDLCSDYGYDMTRCKEELAREIRSAFPDMEDALAEMNTARQTGDHEAFVTAYAQFGRAMLKNQFTFQTVLSVISSQIEMKYVVEGEIISRIEKNLHLPGSKLLAFRKLPGVENIQIPRPLVVGE